MFQGVLPGTVIAQMIRVGGLGTWPEVYSCCSGTFRFERAVIQTTPGALIRSNDVSLYSCALGTYLTRGEILIRFKGALEFIEDLVTSFDERVAAVVAALDMAGFGTGRINRFKAEHLRYFRNGFRGRIDRGMERLERLRREAPIGSFHARDWRAHVDAAIAAGAGVAAFPPFFKAGYERMFKFLDDNVEWESPQYDIYDPKDLHSILEKIHDAGIPYCVISDQLFPDLPLVSEYLQGRGRPHYVYARNQAASIVRVPFATKPFVYTPIDPARLSADTKVRLLPVEAKEANYIRECYLARRIVPASGMANWLVFLDDMLLGCLVYALSTQPTAFGHDSIYLLADVTTTRAARLSKMLARLALSNTIIEQLSHRYIIRFRSVVTTAFSEHPVAMKYRGSWRLHSRKPADDGGFMINYVGEVLPDDPQAIWQWYWQRDGRKLLMGPAEDRGEAA